MSSRPFQWGRYLLPVLCCGYLAVSRIACGSSESQIRFVEKEERVEVWHGKELLTQYWWNLDDKGTYYPLRAPGGIDLTRAFPMEEKEGEDIDHPHHRSLFFGHQDINGYDFWSAIVTQGKRPSGFQRHRKLSFDESGEKIISWIDWEGEDGLLVLKEERTLRFRVIEPNTLVIDFTSALEAGDQIVHFGDTKDGSLGLRVPSWLLSSKQASSGTLRNAEGAQGEEVWGKVSPWIEVTGKSPKGTTVSITMLFGKLALERGQEISPPRWHARTYGLLALNPFSERSFDSKLPEKKLQLHPGQKLVFQTRLILGDGQQKIRDSALSLSW